MSAIVARSKRAPTAISASICASLGLASLVTDEMLAAGERAARRAATLAL